MPDRFLIGIVAFFGFVIVARWVHESGLRQLSPDQKAALLDSQVGIRKYSLLVVIPLVVAAFYLPVYAPWLILAYVVALLSVSYRRLEVSALPPSFRRAFITYCGLYLAGAIVFFGVIYLRELAW